MSDETLAGNEVDVLESLIHSEGWRLLRRTFEQEWGRAGARYGDLLERMANTTDRVQAAEDIQRVIWVRKEIDAFFARFEQRLAQLKAGKVAMEAGPSRRGVL